MTQPLRDETPTTDAMLEYLAEAYRIAYNQDGNAYVSTSALADVLHVKPPAVTRMVYRLKEAGYLEHEPYRGIRLTPAGERTALAHIRKHRLVERFLVDVMGFGWDEVHDHADAFGAAVSDTLVERMNTMAGYPRRCPHGEPIPSADGKMPRVHDYPLHQAEPSHDYVLSRVASHDGEKLRYLAALGIRPGTTLHLIDRAPFHGPLHIRAHAQTHFIGHELADALRVCSQADYDTV